MILSIMKWSNMAYTTILYLLLELFSMVNSYNIPYSSCIFNPLCTCSKIVPDLGIVTCIDVPLPRVPVSINSSRINDLNFENNGLRILHPHSLYSTGLYTLRVSKNPVYMISEEAFSGLERSLRELELSYLHLTVVPNRAIKHLQKLRTINLSGNDISEINLDSWRGLTRMVETIILRENAITYLPKGVFGNLAELKSLDLSGNIILDIEPDAFYPVKSRLLNLYLADNQLRNIPYTQMHQLKYLRVLDLSYNFITQVTGGLETADVPSQAKFSLFTLRLDYNNIEELPTGVFRHFEVLNKTYLDGNPIWRIHPEAFREVQMSEISLSGCDLDDISPFTFKGLERSVQTLDLSNNNITNLPETLLLDFVFLKTLYIQGNKLQNLVIPEKGPHLHKLDISGSSNAILALQDFRRVKNLRWLSVSKVKYTLSPEDFDDLGLDLEELRITDAGLKTIKGHVFTNARGIRRLELSNNAISNIDPNAFFEIGHSLLSLGLSHAFSSSLTTVPAEILIQLTSLQFLDLSYNFFNILPENTFHTLRELQTIHLQDCRIKILKKGTFQGDIHHGLKDVLFSYNLLQVVSSYTFADLKELQRINLDDNQITKIEKRAFTNLDKLQWLYLRGNKIEVIEDEAFQNLPKLETLDLAYNRLKNFDFVSLDEVGTMASLCLNISYNGLRHLQGSSYLERETIINANIKILDISNNNISDILPGYFRPLESSLIHLYLANNFLTNVTRDTFGSLHQLQQLDLSMNLLRELDFNTFRNINRLQILRLSNNVLNDIPAGIFQGVSFLRIIDLSHNKLRSLPEYLFREDTLESARFSYNQFTRFPFKSFSVETASSLCELDLSYNHISAIHTPDLFARFKALMFLDLSGNRIFRLEDSLFGSLPLLHLDLSHNHQLQFEEKGRSFNGLENTLQTLYLKNVSLERVPELPFNSLLHLQVSGNKISNILPDVAVNLSSLRLLDISYNELTAIPIIILSLPNLRTLSLSKNKINTLANSSLLSGGQRIRMLDIAHLPLEVFQTGTLSKMVSLNRLHISTYKNVNTFNIPAILEQNFALRHLQITVNDRSTLNEEMYGKYPPKLRNITITGKQLQSINNNIFTGVSFPNFSFTLRNTSVEKLTRGLFQHMNKVRYISLDVRNNSLTLLENPSTNDHTGHPIRNFLVQLYLSGNEWLCSCQIGWVEMWARKKRQLVCENSQQSYDDCYKMEDDIRETYCKSGKKTSLIDALKTDLECGQDGVNAGESLIIYNILMVIPLFSYFFI